MALLTDPVLLAPVTLLAGGLAVFAAGAVMARASMSRGLGEDAAARAVAEARAVLAEERAADRQARLAPLEAEARELRQTLIEVERDAARLDGALETERRAHAARLEELRTAEARLSKQFQSLATDALGENSRRFLGLVSERFERHAKGAEAGLAAREQAIGALLGPVSEALARFETRLGDVEKAREGAYRSVEAQVAEVARQNATLGAETRKLVQALRAPKTRGRWGEMQARRVFEICGMLDRVDFLAEASVADEEGRRLRPDFVVHLPGARRLVIDAKTPLDAYLDLLEAETAEAEAAALQRHAGQLRTQVKRLASKAYWQHFDDAPDMVVMFVPGEAIQAAAMEADPALFEDAFSAKVLIATPTTLVALMKAAAFGWQQERLGRNTRAIHEAARQLHDRLVTLTRHLGDLGGALGGAVAAYNRSIGSLEARVLPAARRFEELGVTAPEEAIEEPATIDLGVRATASAAE
ncbi:MAG: DNA recombination protein RmuC [Pseudomonadota bacterium]